MGKRLNPVFRNRLCSGVLIALAVLSLPVLSATVNAQDYGPALPPAVPPAPAPEVPPEPVQTEKFPYLVTTEQTDLWIREGDLRIIDMRKFLDFHVTGHIPGSVRMRWTDFAEDPVHGGPPVMDPYRIGKAFQKAAVSGGNIRVVVVGDPRDEWDEAAYAVYALRTWGHVRTALLVGGLPFWAAQGRPLSHGFDSPPPGEWRTMPLQFRYSANVDVAARLKEPGLVLLDVRTPDEFGGARLFGEPRGGHLPGARNFDPQKLMNSDGLIWLDSVPQLMADAGIFPSVPVIVYDYGGVKAALVWVVLRHAGFEQVDLFPGGFYEWSLQPGLPVEPAPITKM